MEKKQKLTYSVPEAAEVVGVSRSKMYEIIRIEGFPILRWGGCLRIPVDKLKEWIDSESEKGWRA